MWVNVSTKHPKQNSKTPDFIRVLGFFFISNLDEQFKTVREVQDLVRLAPLFSFIHRKYRQCFLLKVD